MKKLRNIVLLMAFALADIRISVASFYFSEDQLSEIGYKIWRNECNNSLEKLTSWNLHEQWPSLGIGHFIWYPPSVKAPFTQTFPQFIEFLSRKNIKTPSWLTGPCPWKDRQDFTRNVASPKMKELRDLLQSTIKEQTAFIAHQFLNNKDQLVHAAQQSKKIAVSHNFAQLASFDKGLYALIDYANFKGFGLNPQEKYDGKGWGLLQVLEEMPSCPNQKECLNSFVQTAQKLLTRRIDHAPTGKPEKQWLLGWMNRIHTYLS